MRFNESLRAFIMTLSITACGSSGGSASNSSGTKLNSPTNPSVLPVVNGDNVMPVSINGSKCSANSYPNKPYVSVTICEPGTTNCQTIDDILLDTGSYGLRIFASKISVNLTQQTSGSRPVAACAQFGDGSADWGPVKLADVVLANEPAVQVPIHVIDSTFAQAPTVCANPETSSQDAGFNGILGVGMFAQDCGQYCETHSDNNLYFSCAGSASGSSCTGVVVAVTNQVKNPVAALPADNNGHLLQMPSVDAGGTTSAQGYFILGIGTRSNNTPTDVTTYTASSSTGYFSTQFSDRTYDSFLDTGSNAFYFGGYSGAPDCKLSDPNYEGWYCPSSKLSLSAINYSASSSSEVSFAIDNFISLWQSSNNVFAEMAGGGDADTFDWGLPFYLGRNIWQGIEGTTSQLGSGTYWAY